jgi:hypothetical protein
MNLRKLSAMEKKTYNYIKDAGEIQTTNLPKQMWGAIPNLKNMGLVEVFKKYTSYFKSRKKKFVKIKTKENYSRLMVSEDRKLARIGVNLVNPNGLSTQLMV